MAEDFVDSHGAMLSARTNDPDVFQHAKALAAAMGRLLDEMRKALATSTT